MLVAVVLTFGLLLSGQSTSAQSSCKKATGNLSEVADGNHTTGAITAGGILNGMIESDFTSGGLPTPDPTTFSYTRDFTITTNQGQLKTNIVGMGDFSTGLATEIGRINPATSTGRFAGATGVIFTSGKSTDGFATIQFEITGEICFANE
jgi:hypothetical protein